MDITMLNYTLGRGSPQTPARQLAAKLVNNFALWRFISSLQLSH